MEKKITLAVRMSDRTVGASEINKYYEHALKHDGKLLFTLRRNPQARYRELIKRLLITNSDGSVALIAKVKDLSQYNIRRPSGDYSYPKTANFSSATFWFELEEVEMLKDGIVAGEFISRANVDLLDSLKNSRFSLLYLLNEEHNHAQVSVKK